MNVQGGKIHTDTTELMVADESKRVRGRAVNASVTLTPQTAISVALELLWRAAASRRVEPVEIERLAALLHGVADDLREWSASGTRQWYGSN